jgi:3-oxoacyl-[acyl-carrier-protein] synthase III
MAINQLTGVRVAGIASAVPARVVDAAETAAHLSAETIAPEDARKIADSIGVHRRRVGPKTLCTSDLCFAASERLLADLGWERSSIDLLIFISQSPDYDLPATSCCLQKRLGLGKHCAAFDINLGCSGYAYGLWVAASMLRSGSARRALLLVGDTSSRNLSPYDRSVIFLFGDAGAATALEDDGSGAGMAFSLGTDGGGADHLIIPGGGYRNRFSEESLVRKPGPDGVWRNQLEVYMNGAEIFAFTLREVPPLVRGVLAASGWTIDDLDGFVPHQANLFMLLHLAKKLKIPADKLILGFDGFGNTSSASIPLAMTNVLAPRLRTGTLKLLLAGFGVGLSWGAVTLSCGPLVMPDLVVVEDAPAAASGASL